MEFAESAVHVIMKYASHLNRGHVRENHSQVSLFIRG